MDQTSVLQLLSDYKRTRGPHHGIRSLGIFGSMARDHAASASDVDIVRYRERMNPLLKARIDREGKYVG